MSNEFDEYDDEYERPELDPPDPDAEDPRVERKRRRRAPSVSSEPVGAAKAASAKTATPAKPKPSDEDWGFEDEEEGSIAEWKLGLVLVLVLVGGFGFVAWRKYDTIKAIAQAKLEDFKGADDNPVAENDSPNTDETLPTGVVMAPPTKPRTDGITTADSSLDTNPFNAATRKDRSAASFTSLGTPKKSPARTVSTNGAVPPPSDASGWDAAVKSSPTLATTKPKNEVSFDFDLPSQSEPSFDRSDARQKEEAVDVFNIADAKARQQKTMGTTGFAASSPAGSGPATDTTSFGLAPIDLGDDPFTTPVKSSTKATTPSVVKSSVRTSAPQPNSDKPLAEVASNDPFAVPLLDDPFGTAPSDQPGGAAQPMAKKPSTTLPEDPFGFPTQPVATQPAGKPASTLTGPGAFDLPDVSPTKNDLVEQWSPKPKSVKKPNEPAISLGLEPLPEDPFALEPIVEKSAVANPKPFQSPQPAWDQPVNLKPSPSTANAKTPADPFGLEPVVKKPNVPPTTLLPEDPFGLPPVATTPAKSPVTLPEPAMQRPVTQRPVTQQPFTQPEPFPSRSTSSTTPNGFGNPTTPFTSPALRPISELSTGPQRVDTAIATRRYKVGDGENYWAISKSQYGTVRYFAALAVWNKKVVEDPRHLRPGMTIELPPADLLEPLVKTANLPTVSPRSSNPIATLRPEAHTARQHKVATGESYWSISKSQYGSSRYFAALAEWNKTRIPDPRKLAAGTIIDLPAAKDLEPLVASASPNGPAPPTSTDTGANGFFKTASGEARYRVGPNETLTGIAQKTLGRASRWRQIYAMNGDLLRSPEKIGQGVVLRLPPDSLQVAGGQ